MSTERQNFPLIYKDPWRTVAQWPEELKALQRELELEVGPLHPLHSLHPKVFARSVQSDDILVSLEDGRFAIVHLVWHGHVDQVPDKFPATGFLDTIAKIQELIDSDAKALLDEG